MSEFDEKLNALLSNPDSMAQIMQLAQSLSGEQNGESSAGAVYSQPSGQSVSYSQPSGQQPVPSSNGAGLLSGLTNGLNGLDPQWIAKLLPVIQALNCPQDSNARTLLYALRPYLKPQRQEKVERALQLARLLQVGRRFLSGWRG